LRNGDGAADAADVPLMAIIVKFMLYSSTNFALLAKTAFNQDQLRA
jgi:hypothetical protein